MSEQPTKEWDEMDAQTQQEIKARLHAAVANVDRVNLRRHLASASRSGLAARLAQN